MNTRHKEIGDFFSFLQDNEKKQDSFEVIFEKLENEIKEEQKIEPDINKNEYLNSLLQVHTNAIGHFEKSKMLNPEKITQLDFKKFMDYLMQDVSLHGLGSVEWDSDDW